MIDDPQNLQQEHSEHQEQINSLLNHYNLKRPEQLINILSSPSESKLFAKEHANFTNQYYALSEELKKFAIKHTYKSICAFYSDQENLLQEAKYVLRYKYENHEIIRTHQDHKAVWEICSTATLKKKINDHYYQVLSADDLYPEFYGKVIDADVVRTLDEKSEESHLKLSNILKSYAKRNPFIGYCQGMNFIANFLIVMQFNEEESFWIITSLLEDIMPKTYYSNMMGVAVDLKIIELYLKSKRNRIYTKLQEIQIDISIISLEWLVCVFTTALPFYLLVIVWDFIMLQGSCALIKTAIIMIDELETLILEAEDFTHLLNSIEKVKKKIFIEEDQFIRRFHQIHIHQNILELARKIYQDILNKKNLENQKKIAGRKKLPVVKCNIQWPICFDQLNKNKCQQTDMEVWVFKEHGPPKFIENYMDLKAKKISKKVFIGDDLQEKKKVRIGRISHICHVNSGISSKFKNNSIELSDYDSENGTYDIPISQVISDFTYSFLQNAAMRNSNFKFRVAPKN